MNSSATAGRLIILKHILQMAVRAVDPGALTKQMIHCSELPPGITGVPIGATFCAPLRGLQPLCFANHIVRPEMVDRLIVLGTGKASAAMALGFEQGLRASGESGQLLLEKLSGIVNVPDGTELSTERIEIIGVRPQGQNTVTDRVLSATQRQIDLIYSRSLRDLFNGRLINRVKRLGLRRGLSSLGKNDIVIDLISGGGSANRELWCDGLSTEDFEPVRRALSEGGATIEELNTVRKCCSLVKGGWMNRLTAAGIILPWVLSDVVGDPLDFIASGPWASSTSTPVDALRLLKEYGVVGGKVYNHIAALAQQSWKPIIPGKNVKHSVIGNNEIALNVLEAELRKVGFEITLHGSLNRGSAVDAGIALALAKGTEIWGGETTVSLPAHRPQGMKGGRNQTIVLSALAELWETGLGNRIIFSIGTDGEDGPTDAAGAIVDQSLLQRAKSELGITLDELSTALALGNEYPLLDRMGALLKTGPSGTNVCDLWGVIAYQN